MVWPLVVLAVLRFTRSLRWLLCCAASRRSPPPPDVCSTTAPSNTNRAYLGTDTRSQCLFIGCALAVAMVIVTQRSHEDGLLAAGELWRPASSQGQTACAALGVIGAVGAILIWTLTSTTSSFPYSGGFFLVGLATGCVIVAAVGAPRSIVPRFSVLHRCATSGASPTASTSGTGPSSCGSTMRGPGSAGTRFSGCAC